MTHPATQAFLERLIALHYYIKRPGRSYHPKSDIIISQNSIYICIRCKQSNDNINWSKCCWYLATCIKREILPSDVPVKDWILHGQGDCHANPCKSWKLYYARVCPWTTVGRLMPPAEIVHRMHNQTIISPHSPSDQTCLICLNRYNPNYDLLPPNCICCSRDTCWKTAVRFVLYSFRYLTVQEICPVSDVSNVIGHSLALLCSLEA